MKKWIDAQATKLLKSPVTDKKLFVINKIFKQMIPFNAPHGFKMLEITDNKVVSYAPFKRSNFNHLKTVHACALATAGELSAGMLLTKRFGMGKYRLIMGKMEVDYKYRAQTEVFSTAQVSDEEFKTLEDKIAENGQGTLLITSILKDTNQNHLADVKTTWQLKEWKKISSH